MHRSRACAPIYWRNGATVADNADNYANFCDGSWDSRAGLNERPDKAIPNSASVGPRRGHPRKSIPIPGHDRCQEGNVNAARDFAKRRPSGPGNEENVSLLAGETMKKPGIYEGPDVPAWFWTYLSMMGIVLALLGLCTIILLMF